MKSIKATTNNEKIHFIQGDLSLISSTKETAYKIKDKFPRLDALINNAAVFTHNRYSHSLPLPSHIFLVFTYLYLFTHPTL